MPGQQRDRFEVTLVLTCYMSAAVLFSYFLFSAAGSHCARRILPICLPCKVSNFEYPADEAPACFHTATMLLAPFYLLLLVCTP